MRSNARVTAPRHPSGVVWARSPLVIVGICVGVVAITICSTVEYELLHLQRNQLAGGVVLIDHTLAPDFSLSDQFGAIETLSSLRGRPVVLSFLYTNCPDVCPLIAANLRETHKRLASQAQQIEIVAVTVDPERDTPDNIRRFLDQRGLTSDWRFLTGSRTELATVWSAYHVAARADTPAARPISPAAQQEARGLLPPPALVEHSAPIFLIDRHGALRAMLPVDASPETLTTDLRVLLEEG